MDLDPEQQAFWRFLSLTAYNIHVQSTRAKSDLRRLVVLINTLDANIARSAGSRLFNNNFEVPTLERKGQDHKPSSTGRDDVNEIKYDEADDFDNYQGSCEAESLDGANEISQSDSNTGQACLVTKHCHTGDNMTWQAYRVPAWFDLPLIAEEDEEVNSNDHGPVGAIDTKTATEKYDYWKKQKSACCYVSIADISEVESCF